MIDWTKPIETVPDALNPEPVACEFMGFDKDGDAKVQILEPWENEDIGGAHHNVGVWYFHPETGTPDCDFLPALRNVAEPEAKTITPQAIGSAALVDPAVQLVRDLLGVLDLLDTSGEFKTIEQRAEEWLADRGAS